VIKAIQAAAASAVNDYELDRSNLFVKSISVDQGTVLRRWMPKARGRATPLRKPTCHINVVVAEVVDSGRKESKKQSVSAPIRLDESKKAAAEEKVETKVKAPKDAEIEKGKGRQGSVKKGVNKMFQRKTG
jgi:large subunit ribosomal protein L22